MRAVHTADFKVVQELDTPLTVGISLITFADLQSKQEFLSKKIMTAGMVCGNLNTVNPQKIVRLSFLSLVFWVRLSFEVIWHFTNYKAYAKK